jgi:hypothetical protein
MAENKLEQVVMSIVDNINGGWEMNLAKWELANDKKTLREKVVSERILSWEPRDTLLLKGFPDLAWTRVGLYKIIAYRVAVPSDERYCFEEINIPGFWRRIKFSRTINKIINQVLEQKRIEKDNALADKIMGDCERSM